MFRKLITEVLKRELHTLWDTQRVLHGLRQIGEQLTHLSDALRYLDTLAAASPRVRSRRYGASVEGRPLRVVGNTEYGDVKVELVSYTRPGDWTVASQP